MSEAGPLFVVTGPSGSGKSTLIHALMEKYADLAFSVSHTTREMRPGEVDGRDYHFVPRAEFERMIAAGEFLEWAPVHTHLYGTSLAELGHRSDQGQPVILDIDVQGAAAVRKIFPERAVLVFVAPPSLAELRHRLVARGQEADLAQRIASARDWLDQADRFDFVVVNDQLPQAQAELAVVFAACRSLTRFRLPLLRRLREDHP
ncbi:MAG TPA: guanylate kinase [Candidatus Aminicenantes bacterium]|nr:guanylate kinase [Candidatus Aminicenantes bacterium]